MQTITHINYAAVLVSALAYYGLGRLWYSRRFFAEPWLEALNLNPDEMKKGPSWPSKVAIFISAFVISFAMAALVVMTGCFSIRGAMLLGLIAAVGFVTGTQLINSLFEKRPLTLLFINGGYHLAGCIIAAIIETLWRSI